MTGPRRDAEPERRTGAFALLVAIMTGIAFVPNASAASLRPGEVSVAFVGGAVEPVGSLADYQWDVRPHVAWGAQALVGYGPVATGLRFLSTGTTQSLGLPGANDPTVRANSVELVARVRLATWRVLSLHATASGGRLALRWDPQHVTVDTGGTPVEVELAPIHEWVGGAGLALEAPLFGGWSAGMEGERRVYALDTAHRSGSGVVYGRETFGDWSARFSLRRAWHL